MEETVRILILVIIIGGITMGILARIEFKKEFTKKITNFALSDISKDKFVEEMKKLDYDYTGLVSQKYMNKAFKHYFQVYMSNRIETNKAELLELIESDGNRADSYQDKKHS